MRDLKVTLVQSMLHWEDAAANRAMFGQKLGALKGTTDLILLPEMWTTGFSMRSSSPTPSLSFCRARAINTQMAACVY